MVTRRDIVKSVGLGAIVSGLPGVSLAKADTDARFVLIVLRGAVDGLALAAPYGDPDYRKVRGELAIATPGSVDGLLDLDGYFGLHPRLSGVMDMYRDGQALLVHAVASPYRERSHFDGQDILENGAAAAGEVRNGWLNRALQPLGGSLGDERAIALAQNTPLVLRGDNSVTSWAPSQLPDADDSTLRRLQDLYADDEFFATRLTQALKSQSIAKGMDDMDDIRRANGPAQMLAASEAAARFLTASDGPRIAVLEAGGWDTHANQGAASGALANQLGGLDAGLTALQKGLGGDWENTIVAVVTEFGRTVRVNGTRGTDHGTATAALLLGGGVDGGRVVANWPGLTSNALFQGRDLQPTMDIRSVFKGVLADHLGLEPAFIEQSVFPHSQQSARLGKIVRT